jgi:MraZ protein
VLIQWKPTHLTLFPGDVWEGVQGRLLELRRSRPELEPILRDVTSRATEVTADKQGRILIPAWFKERARLDGSVLLIGAMDRIEIWDPAIFQSKHPDDLAEDAARATEIHQIFG